MRCSGDVAGFRWSGVENQHHEYGRGSIWQGGDYIMVIGASATYGDAMKTYLTGQGAQWIQCAERPFSVQRYVLDVPTQE